MNIAGCLRVSVASAPCLLILYTTMLMGRYRDQHIGVDTMMADPQDIILYNLLRGMSCPWLWLTRDVRNDIIDPYVTNCTEQSCY
jgi:hypothetical protein